MFNNIHADSKNCIFKAQVKPTQRDKSYLGKHFYELWFAVCKSDGSVITGYCECKGGADGACRHLAASLYELEAFELKSCTDTENKWKRKARQSDQAIDIRSMSIVAAKYNSRDVLPPNKPFSDNYDPRAESQRTVTTEEEKREFGLRLKKISRNTQALDILLHPDDTEMKVAECIPDPVKDNCIAQLAKNFSEANKITLLNFNDMCQSFYKTINFYLSIVSEIQTRTYGQASNELWFQMRNNLLTASNFGTATKYIDKGCKPSDTFMSSIIGETRLDEHFLPPPLKWGRKKETIARVMYSRLIKHTHKTCQVIEKGLLVSNVYPGLGCSIDGMCSCKCKPTHHNAWLVEIKCPFSKKNQNPKDVAIENNCVLDRSTGQWMVTAECPYYAQMQGQLGLYGYKECDLVIYTSLGIHVSKMIFDLKYFSEMADKLSLFYIRYVVPKVLSKLID